MGINEAFDKLFAEYLTEGQLSLPMYCGGSIVCEEDDNTGKNKIYSVDLEAFSQWAVDKQLTEGQAKFFKDFIQEKIDNGTLYTPASMQNYPLIKRFQLFVNSNIAEHKITTILHGTLLEGNDLLTIESVAQIGEDGCALADVSINNIGVEVKVTKDDTTKQTVLTKAHKQPVVAVYVISPGSTDHWKFYVRNSTGEYLFVNNVLARNYLDFDKAFIDLVFDWQTSMQETGTLPLVYFEDKGVDGVTITKMAQR